jgi:hypothetical protein
MVDNVNGLDIVMFDMGLGWQTFPLGEKGRGHQNKVGAEKRNLAG